MRQFCRSAFLQQIMLLLSLTLLFGLLAQFPSLRNGFLIGLVWGLGFFMAGVSWVYVSLSVYGGMATWLAALATFLFCAFLALFPAMAGALQARWRVSRCVTPTS